MLRRTTEVTRIAASVPKEREAEVLQLLRGVVRLAVPKPVKRRAAPSSSGATKKVSKRRATKAK